jgi:long-chain acyl-CoA synthetase
MPNPYEFLLAAGAETPDRPAIEFGERRLSYGELADRSLRVGGALRAMGIEPGRSIGLMLPNMPEFVAALHGAWIDGAVVVPFNVLLAEREIRYQIEDSDIALMVVHEAFVERVEQAIEGLTRPPRIAVVGEAGRRLSFDELLDAEPMREPHAHSPETHIQTIYTSGTTGKPKGAVITAANLRAQLEMAQCVFNITDETKYLCVLPLFHVFGLNAILAGVIHNRATMVLHPKFEAEAAVRSLESDAVTDFAGVPTMFFFILKQTEGRDVRFPSLTHCITGGAPMPVEVLREFERRFGATIYEGYGLTETTVSVCCGRSAHVRKIGSIGRPYDGVEMRVVDDAGAEIPHGQVGEIVVRGPNLMRGYLNKPEATAEAIRDGWFHTGDLGKRDDEGYFFIVDRKKDMILRGGCNIYPREIEEVIYELPEVSEAAVVGLPDEAKGETVAAAIAFKPGKSMSEAAMREHVEARVAKYKRPSEYVFLDALPKGPTGKILKRELRDRWPELASPRAGA